MKIEERYRLMDDEIQRRLDLWSSRGMPTPCRGCKETHCCRQFVLAFEDECQHIAKVLDARQIKRLSEWVWKYLELPADVQDDEDKYFDLNLDCPFLEEGRCSIYAARPSACRTHNSLDERSPGACQGEAPILRYFDAVPVIRLFPPDDFVDVSPAWLRVAALVCKGKISRRAEVRAKAIAASRLDATLKALGK